MNEKKERKAIAVLNALHSAGEPLSSEAIADALTAGGEDISERTVRLYLADLDATGLTRKRGGKGRVITEAGRAELAASSLLSRVGVLSARIDQYTYRMSFDLATRTGTVVVNTSLMEPGCLEPYMKPIQQVFAQGFAMGRLCGLLGPGERLGDLVVPRGQVGFCTVCSITLNGVLLKHGIPMHSRFGGLLELSGRKPVRFVEMITYDGTSLDPLEVFIRSGMTDYLGAIATGSGRIGASFREVPAESRPTVASLDESLARIGLGGFMRIGMASRPLLNIPVSEGRCGAIVIGGLNPVAVLEENGIRVASRALSGLMDFARLFPYEELEGRLASLLGGRRGSLPARA